MTRRKAEKSRHDTTTTPLHRTAGRGLGEFSLTEMAAMKERARELKAEARTRKNKEDGDRTVLAKIAELPAQDRALGERLHAIVRTNAPDLVPKLWYGMPAYANQSGKAVCFFQAASKFQTRYATFAFTDEAALDEGTMWPTGFGLKTLSAGDEATIAALVRKAVVK